ncbi:ATPase [Psychrobacter sp. FDAARGOS_221]|nr:ATPase [Psychrobacter sp. FDAARGOS_221]
MSDPNFYHLPIIQLRDTLRQQLASLKSQMSHSEPSNTLAVFKQQWQLIHQSEQQNQHSAEDIEAQQVDWLIRLFNALFASQNVVLVRGKHEPEYFPATEEQPARIQFAHGFFQSALHEISHWSIAGARRRTLSDFGYWYAPDGRTEAQQKVFEQVEIKPQAIECLFSLMCGRRFRVSQDNLHADFDTSQSTFAVDVFNQATHYINQPQTLPKDAQTLLTALAYTCRDTIVVDEVC